MKIEAEPDHVESRFVLGVAAAALSITLLASFIAWSVLRGATPTASLENVHRLRAERPRASINAVEADLFAGKQGDEQRKRAQKRLRSFGWSERDHGLVHVPIERAFELYLAGARARSQP